MFPLGKLIGILAVKRTLDTTMFHQLLVGISMCVMLTVVTALMLAILMMGGLYGVYALLMSYGLVHEAAVIMVGSLAVLITVVLILLIRVQISRMNHMIKNMFKQQSPITSQITDVAQSFISGLMSPARQPVVTPIKKNQRKG